MCCDEFDVRTGRNKCENVILLATGGVLVASSVWSVKARAAVGPVEQVLNVPFTYRYMGPVSRRNLVTVLRGILLTTL
jgi:hypothetical protein